MEEWFLKYCPDYRSFQAVNFFPQGEFPQAKFLFLARKCSDLGNRLGDVFLGMAFISMVATFAPSVGTIYEAK